MTMKNMTNKDYKKKYYRVLATLWIVLIIGCLFMWNIHNTLDEIYVELEIMDKNTNAEIIKAYKDNGWVPYEWKIGE